MEKNDKIKTLIKYDYRFLFYFKEQMISFQKQYVYKYDNKNKYQIYLITREKYNKSLRKKEYYEKLYLRNKYLYYIIFSQKLFSKYIRKQLYKDLISLFKSVLITFILEYFGVKTKLKQLIGISN